MKRVKTLEDVKNELTNMGIMMVEDIMDEQVKAIGDLCVDPRLAKMYHSVFEKIDSKVKEYI